MLITLHSPPSGASACGEQAPGLKKARLRWVALTENYAWSAGLVGFSGLVTDRTGLSRRV